ncbi:MAG: hypothetical protein MI861_10830, partial [Pirellulales bacterium]|nr:hypothetical protein [Pirellulales bacterium]
MMLGRSEWTILLLTNEEVLRADLVGRRQARVVRWVTGARPDAMHLGSAVELAMSLHAKKIG